MTFKPHYAIIIYIMGTLYVVYPHYIIFNTTQVITMSNKTTIKPNLGSLQELITFLKDSQFTHISQNKYTLYCKKSKVAITQNNESFTQYIEHFKSLFGKDGIVIPTSDIIESNEFRWLSLTPSKKPLDREALGGRTSIEIDLSKLIHKDCALFASLLIKHNINTFIVSRVTLNYDLSKPYLHLEDNVLNLADSEEYSKPYKSVKEGDWSMIKHHLMNLVGEEVEIFDHIIQLYARKLRFPLVRDTDQTIIFYDRGGTGKSLWFQILDELNGNISGLVKPADRIYIPNFHRTKFSYMSEIDSMGAPSTIMGRVKVLTEAIVVRDRKGILEEYITNYNLIHLATNNLGWLEAEESKRRWVLANGGDLKLEDYFASKGVSESQANAYFSGISALKFGNSTSSASTSTTFIQDQISAFVHYLMHEVTIKENIGLVKSELYNQVFEAKSSQYANHPFNIFLKEITIDYDLPDLESMCKAWYDAYGLKSNIAEAVLKHIFQEAIESGRLVIGDKSIKIANTLLRQLFEQGEPRDGYKKPSFSYFCKVCKIDVRKVYRFGNDMIKGQTFKKEGV